MDTHSVDFHIAEYNSLRMELLLHTKQRISALLYTVTANAAILGFVISNTQQGGSFGELIIIASWLPTILSMLGWAHYYESVRNINRIAKYCAEIEHKFALLDVGLGWENHLQMIRKVFGFRARYLFNAVFALQLGLAIYLGVIAASKF